MTIKFSISDILFYISAIFCVIGYFSGEYLSSIINGIFAIFWYYNMSYKK